MCSTIISLSPLSLFYHFTRCPIQNHQSHTYILGAEPSVMAASPHWSSVTMNMLVWTSPCADGEPLGQALSVGVGLDDDDDGSDSDLTPVQRRSADHVKCLCCSYLQQLRRGGDALFLCQLNMFTSIQ
ncbi:hypothetical protein AMECASPLE_029060 [Ameca splendens]|uniref:Uncharacterized protein n=1 Tax=Ameca splendens TaxID=208324 RepID=A0ABV0YH38_9TELE